MKTLVWICIQMIRTGFVAEIVVYQSLTDLFKGKPYLTADRGIYPIW